MKKRFFVVFAAFFVFIMLSTTVQPVGAWLWSNKYNVNVNVTFKPNGGLLAWDAIDCNNAKLYVNGVVYTATVKNPWLSNKCTVSFNNVTVSKNGNYTMNLSYKYYLTNKNTNNSIYLSRPLGSTLTKSLTIYP